MSINVELGRKVPVPVMLTTRLLDRIDALAAKEAKPGEEPNRSAIIRRMLGEAVERAEDAARPALKPGEKERIAQVYDGALDGDRGPRQ